MPVRPPLPTMKTMSLPAPTGGLNALVSAMSLAPTEALLLYNLTAAELGSRVRSGWSEWVTGLTGFADNQTRTLIPFSGSHKNGSTDKLFAVTSTGIWDVTTSGAKAAAWAPATQYFAGSTSQVGSIVTNSGNLYVATQSGTSMVSVTAWAPGAVYSGLEQRVNGGNIYICTSGGTSAGSGGPTGTGTGIADGSCTWDYVASYGPGGTGTGILDGTPLHGAPVIWSYVSTNTEPSLLVTFGTQTGDAGYGTLTVMSTPAGRFLLYCDEENGLYIWSESDAAWIQPVSDTTQAWEPQTLYVSGDLVVNDSGKVYVCVSDGTSNSSGGPTGTSTAIGDGTTSWDYAHAQADHAIGPSLNDQRLGYTADPANFAAVCVWKSKVWLVEKDTSRAFWLDTNSIYGTATSQDFGGKMRKGGPLTNLYNWSYDAGDGMDTLLVGISTAGDIVIYRGTDPSSASTFGIVGAWSVGGVPYGRKIATEDGGELVVATLQGSVEMSKLIAGAPAAIGGQNQLFESDKIAPLFNLDAQTYYSNRGWEIGQNPVDNALWILVPSSGSGVAAKPYVMSRSNRSWSIYRDLPLITSCVWNGVTYFGTADGRVARVGGYVDAVLLHNSSSFSQIDYSWLSGFTDGGMSNHKQIQMIQPMLETQEASPPVNAVARYNLDTTECPAPVSTGTTSASGWDAGKWDQAVWGGAYTGYEPIIGAVGSGRRVAIAVRGRTASRTAIIGACVFYQVGGQL